MEKLIVASNNKGKIAEIKSILGSFFHVVSLADEGIEIDVAETGDTFAENALIKAKTIYDLTRCATLSDDSGLLVDALNDAPGVYSARYAGAQHNDADNNALLLKNLTGVKNRNARFKSVIVLYRSPQNIITAEGFTEGEILYAPEGDGGFGYDCLFFSKDLNKSFGLATMEEKNKVSHRARALAQLRKQLEK